MKPLPLRVGTILVLGVLCVSTSAIFVRLCFETAGISGVGFSLFIAASRLLLAALVLVPAWGKVFSAKVKPQAYYYAGAAGLALALHFATWITSLSFTSVAASTTLVTTNPVWVALLSWWWFKEKPTKLTIIGIAIALWGGIIIALGDQKAMGETSNFLLGDSLALVGAWMASLYLLLGRQAQRNGLSITAYITIAYTTAAVVLLPLPLIFGTTYLGYPNLVYVYILLMAIFAQLIGHSSINWAVRWISPTLVTLAILFEPVGASLLAFFLFKEIPSMGVIIGALVLLIGVALAVVGSNKLVEDHQ